MEKLFNHEGETLADVLGITDDADDTFAKKSDALVDKIFDSDGKKSIIAEYIYENWDPTMALAVTNLLVHAMEKSMAVPPLADLVDAGEFSA